MYFHKWIGGYKEPHGLLLNITDDMAQSFGAAVYNPAEYSTSGDADYTPDERSPWGSITDDYYWDDVIDAETDGYPEDDE